MNARSQEIFLRFLNTNDGYTIDDLANYYNVSNRSIYNDLKEIDEFLQEYNIKKLKRKDNVISLNNIYPHERELAINNLLTDDSIRYRVDTRTHIIKWYIIDADGFITIDKLAAVTDTSRNTIINDLDQVRQNFEKFNLNLESHKFKGLKLKGAERNKRSLLIDSFMKLPNFEIIAYYLQSEYDKKEILEIVEIIKSLEKSYDFVLSEHDFNTLFVYISITIYRFRNDNEITQQAVKHYDLNDNKGVEIAQHIKKEVEERFKLSLTDMEVDLLADRIAGSRIQRNTRELIQNPVWIELQLAVNKLIKVVSKDIKVSLNEDITLFDDLIAHLRPAYYRLFKKEYVKNPLLREIKNKYADVHKAVMDNIYIIEDAIDVVFSEDETSYITLYFLASLARSDRLDKKRSVLIVTQENIGRSQVLKEQISTIFNVSVAGVFTIFDAQKYVENNDVDLIITTIPIKIETIESIHVDPFLTTKDIIKLSKFLSLKKSRLDINDVIKTIEMHATIDNKKALIEDLEVYLSQYAKTSYKTHPVNEQNLLSALDKEMIALNVDASDMESAIKKGGALLVDAGRVDNNYVEQMLKNANSNKGQFAIAPGVAIPHATAPSSVHQVAISIVVLEKPIDFGHAEYDPIDLIFSLATTDSKSHLKALGELMKVIEDKELLETIRQAKSKEEVVKLMIDL